MWVFAVDWRQVWVAGLRLVLVGEGVVEYPELPRVGTVSGVWGLVTVGGST
jgi:hypothetical protein